MILTNNEEYYQKLKTFRHHGIVKDDSSKESWYYEIPQPGYNFRLTDMQCALGISQMNKLDCFLARRREIASIYDNAFADMHEIITPFVDKDIKHAYHIYVIQLNLERLKVVGKKSSMP